MLQLNENLELFDIMPTKPKLRKREKLVDLGPEHRAAFEQRVTWRQILEALDVTRENEEEADDSIIVACPHCEMEGRDRRVSVSPDDTVFNCSECETVESKLDFLIGLFPHDPRVVEVTKLFGEDCFG